MKFLRVAAMYKWSSHMIFYTENIVLYQICRNVYYLSAVVAMLQFYTLQNMTMLSSDENRK